MRRAIEGGMGTTPKCPSCGAQELLTYPSGEVECQKCGKSFYPDALAGGTDDKAPLFRLPESLTWGGDTYYLDLDEDTFVHLTTRSRAEAIQRDGKLLMHPPGGKMGADAVFAISTVYGRVVSGTQSKHIRVTKDDPLVALVFRTKVIPERGFVEEVSWDRDVSFTTLKIVSAAKGLSLVRLSPVQIGDQDMVTYEPRYRPKSASIVTRVAARFQSSSR